MVRYQFRLAIPVRLRRGDLVGSSKTFASRATSRSACFCPYRSASSIWLNYFRCSSPDEPYAYVQTYNDIFKLTKPLLTLAKRDPSNYHLTGHLIRSSIYPLPWVLGDFDRVGYYEGGNMPANLDGDFLMVQQDKIKDVESKLKGAYYTDMMTLRNYQDPSKIFFSAKVFKDLFPGKAPDFDGNAPKPAPSPAPAKVP